MASQTLQDKSRRHFLKLSAAGVFAASYTAGMNVPATQAAGEFKPIATSASGIQISEHLPKLAKLMHHGAVIRSMSTGEGAHARASYNMHSGYREGQGGVQYPAIGAIVSQDLGKKDFPLP